MPETDIGQTTISSLKGTVRDFSITPKNTEATNFDKTEFYVYFDDFPENYGYYTDIPELNRAINSLATWVIGKGFETSTSNQAKFNSFTGQGADMIKSIFYNQFIVMKFNGDSFAEIVRDDGAQINLKPLDPNRVRIVLKPSGLIKRYDYWNADGWKEMKTRNMFHLSNDRVVDEPKGQSVAQVCKWVIDARREAMKDWRRISHRSTIRVMYIDADDSNKLSEIKTNYAQAIKKGELMIIPAKKEDSDFEDLTLPPHAAFLEWMRYLENVFYQVVGVPRVIATSEGFTEAGSKVGYVTFEPVYTKEQEFLEEQIYLQLATRLKFKRPPSLMSNLQQTEVKNQSQTQVAQPNDVQIGSGEA